MDTNRIKEACEKIAGALKELAATIKEVLNKLADAFKDVIEVVTNSAGYQTSYRVYTRQRYSKGQGIRLYHKNIIRRTKVFHCRNNC